MLLFGFRSAQTIIPHQNEELIVAYQKALDKEAERKMKADEEDAKILEIEEEEKEKEDMMKNSAILSQPALPHLSILFRLQRLLQIIARHLRIIESTFCWDDGFRAFWITTTCIMIGVLLLFIPWGLVCLWLMRFVVWAVLGPWMKLADIFFIKKKNALDEAKVLEEEIGAPQKLEETESTAVKTRTRIENEKKLKKIAMMKFMFGEYTVRVPASKEMRFLDYPLISSSAKPASADDQEDGTVKSRDISACKIGQAFTSSIIPKIEHDIAIDETTALLSENKEYGTSV